VYPDPCLRLSRRASDRERAPPVPMPFVHLKERIRVFIDLISTKSSSILQQFVAPKLSKN
jgi:hypothetical protein